MRVGHWGGVADDSRSQGKRLWTWVLRLAALSAVVPLFCARHLPMSDLPEHLAAMATLRHYGDAAWRTKEYFTLAGIFDTQYWLYHVTGAALSVPFGSVERANLFMLAVIGISYPYALRSLLRAMRLDERLALFAVPMFWSRPLTVGLLNFIASPPVLLFAVSLVFLQAQKPTRRRAVAISLLGVALLYLHLSTFFLFLGQVAIILVVVPSTGGWRGLLRSAFALPRKALWLLPSLVLTVVIAVHGSVGGAGHGMRFTKTSVLVRELPVWMFDTFRSGLDDKLGYCLLALAVPLLLLSRIKRRSTATATPTATPTATADRARDITAVLLFGSVLLAYFSMPSSVGSSLGALDVRMAVFVGLFFPLLLRPEKRRRGSALLGAVALVAVTMSVNASYQVHAYEEEEVGRFDDLLQRMPHGQRLLTLDFHPWSQRVNSSLFMFYGSYYRARYGGVASFSFSELPHWPVRYRPEKFPPLSGTWGNACAFRNARDGRSFDYVMTHGEVDPFSYQPPGPTWTLIGASRAWKLYARNPDSSAAADGVVGSAGADGAPSGEVDHGPCASPPAREMHASN